MSPEKFMELNGHKATVKAAQIWFGRLGKLWAIQHREKMPYLPQKRIKRHSKLAKIAIQLQGRINAFNAKIAVHRHTIKEDYQRALHEERVYFYCEKCYLPENDLAHGYTTIINYQPYTEIYRCPCCGTPMISDVDIAIQRLLKETLYKQ